MPSVQFSLREAQGLGSQAEQLTSILSTGDLGMNNMSLSNQNR